MRYVDELVGTGAALGVTDAAQCDTNSAAVPNVTVHYTGWLNDGTQFDSSVDRGTPAPFNLCGVIPGWTVGVGSMNVGGKRRLIIPAGLAYGPNGRPPAIPGGATLIFDVEVLSSP
jgi:FKBP-type peptidyl-prolyl cis-trans isomerase